MRSIRFIALKEFYHILRDPRSLAIAIAMPLMMTFLYGYAINLDIENIVVSIIDYDQTPESRQLVDEFYRSRYFSPSESKVDPIDPEKILRRSEATAILTIKPGLADALENGQEFELGLLIDGSDNTLAAAVQSYSEAVVNAYQMNRLPPDMKQPGIVISRQVLFNPDLKSSHFFVPGLLAIILMMISALLTSITIAREKETGTMEQLLTAPVSPATILIGKIIPYVVLAFIDGALILVLSRILFGVPFVGSGLLLIGFGLIYVSAALSLGILISSIVKTQQVAMMLALTMTMLPSVMLSGFVFAVKNMPPSLQVMSNVVPAKFFVTIIRGILLKGAGLETLAVQAGYLAIFMTVVIFIASRKFKTRVD